MTTTSPSHTSARPEPVTGAAALAGAIAGVLITVGGLLRVLGIALPFDVQEVANEISNLVMALAVVWAITGPWLLARLRARDEVTPLESPRGADGIPLITTAEAEELVAIARSDAHGAAYDEAYSAALDQARDEYHAAMVAAGHVVDDPGHHAAPDGTTVTPTAAP